jgi:hypothetical protein
MPLIRESCHNLTLPPLYAYYTQLPIGKDPKLRKKNVKSEILEYSHVCSPHFQNPTLIYSLSDYRVAKIAWNNISKLLGRKVGSTF